MHPTSNPIITNTQNNTQNSRGSSYTEKIQAPFNNSSIPIDQININNIFSIANTQMQTRETQNHHTDTTNNHNVQHRLIFQKYESSSTANMSPNQLQDLLSSFIKSEDSNKHQKILQEKNLSQIYIRDKNGVSVANEVGGEFRLVSEYKDFLVFSKQGHSMIVGTSQVIDLYVNNTFQKKYHGSSIQIIEFSPDNNFVILVDKQDNVSRCIILDAINFVEVFNLPMGRFTKSQWPFIRFDSTNSLCFVYNQKDIVVYETANFNEVNRFAGGLTPGSFSLSGPRESLYMTLVEVRQALQQQNQPSQLLIWSYDNSIEPYINRELNAAQEVTELWSHDGRVLLVWTQLLDDESNQSYYGVHHLYHVNLDPKKELKEIELFDGPIHDIGWNANSEFFLVVSGYMPAGSVLFDRNGVQLYLISQHHVNTLNWSPCGQLVCLSGFGNLPGEMEIWNIKDLQLVGQCRKDKVIQFQWSPDSKYFSVATTFPRLRVNNMFQIYSFQGKLIYEQNFTEFYEVKWMPDAQIKIANKLLQIVENPPDVVQKKTMNYQKSNFIKELKGEHVDQRVPRKLNWDDKLTSFCPPSQQKNGKRKVSTSEQPEKGEHTIQLQPTQQPKVQPQMISRRQVPLEQTQQQVESYEQNQMGQMGEQSKQKNKNKPKKFKPPTVQSVRKGSNNSREDQPQQIQPQQQQPQQQQPQQQQPQQQQPQQQQQTANSPFHNSNL